MERSLISEMDFGLDKTQQSLVRAYNKVSVSRLRHVPDFHFFFLFSLHDAILLPFLPRAKTAEQSVNTALYLFPHFGGKTILVSSVYVLVSEKKKKLNLGSGLGLCS
ncbi:hypothetical protein CDAR_609051 [Caerostris darwini]|uniref:Uncharacterized protein n=1 Tax=Caerostris darwini TaxID=1538125 RepID=A0AAV4WN15_9ARAC|nr:hypothetical protein CDAR_609051 [Caerostris darwini]